MLMFRYFQGEFHTFRVYILLYLPVEVKEEQIFCLDQHQSLVMHWLSFSIRGLVVLSWDEALRLWLFRSFDFMTCSPYLSNQKKHKHLFVCLFVWFCFVLFCLFGRGLKCNFGARQVFQIVFLFFVGGGRGYNTLVFQNDPNTLWGDIWTP